VTGPPRDGRDGGRIEPGDTADVGPVTRVREAAPPLIVADLGGDAVGFAALLTKIARDREFVCHSYKEKCLRRRIAVRLRARGVATYAEYSRLLETDPREYDKLLDTLTINVTKLFRNWETFAALVRTVVPALWALPSLSLHIWSAGCASGEEAYSLATLFHRYATEHGEGDRAGRIQVLGTDIDRESLTAATRATYLEPAFADTPPELRAAYFAGGAPAAVDPRVRALVRFARHDLIRDPPPPRQHLIACRNVIIYFDRTTQEELFVRFHDALVPGGFLVLGKVETLLGATRSLFAPVDARERIFRRV
jgi:chemotaxis methyl-accepting protein methylase